MLSKECIQVKQGYRTQVVITSMNISEIDSVCTLSRVHRDAEERLVGYQRSEVANHIDNIARYLTDKDAVIPNSIIICFNSQTKIKLEKSGVGRLSIPTEIKTGLIVDGQQRVAALRQVGRKDFYYPVTIFITDDEDFERQQFLLVNSAKPLSRSLVYELLPFVNGKMNMQLMQRKLPSKIAQDLNYEKDSPLYGLIKFSTNPAGIIADNSMIKLIDNSLREGALYDFKSLDNGCFELERYELATGYLHAFFFAVREIFHQDWGKKPRESRLFHGAGVVCLGQLFDEIYYEFKHRSSEKSFQDYAAEALHKVKPYCMWSSGVWNFGRDHEGIVIERKWNQIQNVPQDISMLSKFLVSKYLEVNGRKSLVKSL